MNLRPIVAAAVAILAVPAACGPELDAPSSEDISGHWSASTALGALSAVEMDLTQQANGTITGDWSGKFSTSGKCPPGLGSDPTGPVKGSNTSLLVRFSLLGAGDFEGQVIDRNTLRGGFASCSRVFPIEFVLTPTVN
jgi:hypothetical protein